MLWVGFPTGALVDEPKLQAEFSKVGLVDHVKVFADRSFAFVTLRTVDDATRALQRYTACHPALLSAQPLRIAAGAILRRALLP